MEMPSTVPPKGDDIEERKQLRELLNVRPLTRGVVDCINDAASRSNDWERRVAEAPKTTDNIPLDERFLETHEKFVRDLSDISYDMGRLENVTEQLVAAKAVEWQTAAGPLENSVFDKAGGVLEASKKKLEGAKEATLRKLEGLMKTGFVQDAIHSDANKELEAFDKGHRQEGQQ